MPPAAAVAGDAASQAAARWKSDVVPALKPMVRAIFSVPKVLGARDGALVLGAPNEPHRAKCEVHRREVEAAIATVVGAAVRLEMVIDGSAGSDHDDLPGAPSDGANVVELHPGGPPQAPTPDEEIDLDDLVDAPPESVLTPIERLAQAFPGSELLDERP
jgi:DNA polymerase-3 subunit gamma/tau